jgi:hypothetical protein
MKYFDEALRLTKLPEPHRTIVEREARALLGQCPSDLDPVNAWGGTLTAVSPPTARPDRHALGTTFAWIAREKLLGQLPLAALVTCPDKLPVTLHARGEAMRSLFVTIGIGLHEFDTDPPALAPCCICVRLALKGERNWLVEQFPDPSLPLEQIYDRLLRLEQEYQRHPVLRPNRSPEHRDARVAEIKVPCGQYLERRPASRRHRDSAPAIDHEIIERVRASNGVDGCSVEVIHETTLTYRHETEEERGDRNPDSQEYVVGQTGAFAPRSLGIAIFEGKEIVNDMAMRSAMTPCDSGQLTEIEGTSLFQFAWSGAHGRRAEAAGAAWTCLSLLSGRDPQELASLPLVEPVARDSDGACWIFDGKSDLMLRGELVLPAHPEFRKAMRLPPQGKHFLLPIPGALARICHPLLTDPERRRKINEQVRVFHRAAREHTNTSRISVNRVAQHMMARLVAAGYDPIIPAMIRGASARNHPGMYYYSTTCAALLDPWLAYSNRLLAAVGAELLVAPPSTGTTRIGSAIEVTVALLRAVLGGMHRLFVATSNTRGCSPIEQHNDMALWTHMVANLACGFRSVRSALDRVSHFRSRTRQLWICDKANRSANASRVIAVAETAGRQLDAYLAHLTMLARRSALFPRSIRDYVAAVLADEASMMFFIAEDGATAEPVAAQPKELEDRLATFLPAPGNFARHFLRQELAARGHPWQLIDAHLGHDPLGRESYGRYSRTSWAQMRTTAAAIDSLLQEIGVPILRGRYAR